MMKTYYLSLGSNIEPRLQHLRQACSELSLIGKIQKISSLYQTEAWGKKEQNDFYNAILEFDSLLEPMELLRKLKTIEKKIGRLPAPRWSARIVDIDIIFCQNRRIDQPDLHIPHAEFSTRRFILEPMEEINRHFLIPKTKKTITDYLKICQDQSRIHKLATNWWKNGN